MKYSTLIHRMPNDFGMGLLPRLISFDANDGGGGGSSDQNDDEGGNDDDTQDDDTDEPGAGGDDDTEDDAAEDERPGKVEDLPKWAQKKLNRANAQAANARAKAAAAEKAKAEAEQARTDAIDRAAKALGLKEDDKPPTVDELTTALAEKDGITKAAQATARAAVVELHVHKIAARPQIGADPEALADSSAFKAAVDKLDPTADDFATKLEALIKKTVEGNPRRFKIDADTAERTGGERGGGTGENEPDDDDESVEAQRRRRAKARGGSAT